jgi:hypothetical protein
MVEEMEVLQVRMELMAQLIEVEEVEVSQIQEAEI